MTLTTPYLIYILAAYGVTLVALMGFLGMTFWAWKKSQP